MWHLCPCFYLFGWADKINCWLFHCLKGSENLWPTCYTSNSGVSCARSMHNLHQPCTVVSQTCNTLISLVVSTIDVISFLGFQSLSLLGWMLFHLFSPTQTWPVKSRMILLLSLSLSFSRMGTFPLWLPTDVRAGDCTKKDFHTRSGSPPTAQRKQSHNWHFKNTEVKSSA